MNTQRRQCHSALLQYSKGLTHFLVTFCSMPGLHAVRSGKALGTCEVERWDSTSKHSNYSFVWKQSRDPASYDGHCFVTNNSTILIQDIFSQRQLYPLKMQRFRKGSSYFLINSIIPKAIIQKLYSRDTAQQKDNSLPTLHCSTYHHVT